MPPPITHKNPYPEIMSINLPDMIAPTADPRDVTDAILHEIQGVLGLARHPWAALLVRAFFGTPARRLAERLVQFDYEIGGSRLADAAGNLLSVLIHEFQVEFSEVIPQTGALLVASNHPGSYDLLVLAASLGRDDLKVISSDIAIFPHLPSVEDHFIPITEDPHRRMSAFRAGLRHLQDGKALLLFPRGDVELDPALSPEAAQSLTRWSASIEMYLRKAPGTHLVVAIVRGVLSSRWFNHPALRIWKKAEQRQKVAEIIQVAEYLFLRRKSSLIPRVSFSPPLLFSQEGETRPTQRGIMQILTQTAQAQLERQGYRVAPSS